MTRLFLAAIVASVIWTAAARAQTPATANTTSKPATEIPLKSVVSTNGQDGVTQVQDGPYTEASKVPALCGLGWAKEFKDLTQDSIVPPPTKDKPFTLGRPADADAQLWAVLWLGSTGSNPPQILIDSVKAGDDGVFEVAYHRAPRGIMTKDLHPYVAWIPLGKLPAGKYTLRLMASGKLAMEATWSVAAATSQPASQATSQPASQPADKQ